MGGGVNLGKSPRLRETSHQCRPGPRLTQGQALLTWVLVPVLKLALVLAVQVLPLVVEPWPSE